MKEFELEPGEHVVRELRKHWFVFLVELLPSAILTILPLALNPLFGFLPENISSTFSPIDWNMPLARALLGVWWLLVWCGAFSIFTRYFLNLWILTNLRVVDIHQKGFFNRQVSSLLLDRVEDVTVNTSGIIASLLDIGRINVQTAGAVDRFSMNGIPHPGMMRDILLKYVETKSGTLK